MRQPVHVAASAVAPRETIRCVPGPPDLERKKTPMRSPSGSEARPIMGLSQGRSTPNRNQPDCRPVHSLPLPAPTENFVDSRGTASSRDTLPHTAPLSRTAPAVALADAKGSRRIQVVSVDKRITTYTDCPALQWLRKGPASSILDHKVLAALLVMAAIGPDA